jgi:hypothetical protein
MELRSRLLNNSMKPIELRAAVDLGGVPHNNLPPFPRRLYPIHVPANAVLAQLPCAVACSALTHRGRGGDRLPTADS